MSVGDIVREFARLTTIGYTAPWNDVSLTEAQQQAAALAMASEWAEILRPATPARLTHAVRTWAARDTETWWPKPGQIAACLPSPRSSAALVAGCPDEPAFVHAAEAERAWPVSEALWLGVAPEEAWPQVDVADPAVRAALDRLAGRGWCYYDAVTALRYAAACRRLLGLHVLLEASGAPHGSWPQIMEDAVTEFGVHRPTTTRADLREWLARRVADDAERLALAAGAWADPLALEVR